MSKQTFISALTATIACALAAALLAAPATTVAAAPPVPATAAASGVSLPDLGTRPSPLRRTQRLVKQPAPPYPLSETFNLASRPGAARTVYLDFDGETVDSDAWAGTFNVPNPIVAPAWTIGPGAAFTSVELSTIQNTWRLVVDDFAPFDVNVTTIRPDPALLLRDGPQDNLYGTHVVISGHKAIAEGCGCGGMAAFGLFDFDPDTYRKYAVSWVVTWSGDHRKIASTISHELGHNFGLSHDGAPGREYYSGDWMWSPIMGSGDGNATSTWSRGEYPNANNAEDDLAIIAQDAPLLPDTTPNDAASAPILAAGGQITGVIGDASDVDTFRVQGKPGSNRLRVTASTVLPEANLDITMRVLDANGTVLADVNPAPVGGKWKPLSPDNPTVIVPVTPSGVITVEITGSASVRSGGTRYGSVGAFALSSQDFYYQAPRVTLKNAKSAKKGRRFRGTISVTGGMGDLAWSARNAPKGLTLKPSATGRSLVLAGRPTSKGKQSISLTGTDATGQVVQARMVLRVR